MIAKGIYTDYTGKTNIAIDDVKSRIYVFFF